MIRERPTGIWGRASAPACLRYFPRILLSMFATSTGDLQDAIRKFNRCRSALG